MVMSTELTEHSSRVAAIGVYVRAWAKLLGGLAIGVAMIPIVILGSAAVMLAAFWPLFVGAYLQYGYVPGEATRNSEHLGVEWWILTVVWLGLLALAPAVGYRAWTLTRTHRTAGKLPAARPRV